MDNCYMKLGAVKAKEIDGELYISCWNFSKALGEKEREISDLCKEIDNLEKQISKLESELAAKKNLVLVSGAATDADVALKIVGLTEKEIEDVHKEVELRRYSNEKSDEKPKVELPTMPIDVASMLINEIIENIKDTVEIVDIIKPIYNFKSSE